MDSQGLFRYNGGVLKKGYLLSLLCLLLPACTQVAHTVTCKQIAPEVAAAGLQLDSWYVYMPKHAPGFCLLTRRAVVWYDPEMHLGSWCARHERPPYRVMMEARDSLFVLHRRYTWDGMSWGCTYPRDLMPTLLHDALYHALQVGAPFPRREADRAFLRARRQLNVPTAYGEYLCIRAFAGTFSAIWGDPCMSMEILPPDAPLTPLEKDRPEPLAGERE